MDEVKVELFSLPGDFFQGGAPAGLAGSKVGFVGYDAALPVARATKRLVHAASSLWIFARFCCRASSIYDIPKNPPRSPIFTLPKPQHLFEDRSDSNLNNKQARW